MSLLRLVIDTDLDATQLADALRLSGAAIDGNRDLQALANFLAGNAGGGKGLNVRVVKNAVRASLAGTFTGDPTAGQALTINGVAFTARASGAVANEFNIVTGANAAPLAAAINASTSAKIAGQVYAVATSAQVITVYALVPGTGGNLFTMTENMDNYSNAGAATALSGGTEDAEVVINAGRPAF